MIILIPARRDSKGLPQKNRKLLEYTLSSIPESYLSCTYISTNDEFIANVASKYCAIHARSESSSEDTAPLITLLNEFVNDLEFGDEEVIITLYLTYPEREFSEVLDAYKFFNHNNLKSLLCKKEPATHPYLCLYEQEAGRGLQVIEHNLYRRQDYPKVFELSHYISIVKVNEIQNLNNNLYNSDTFFYCIGEKIDVDTQKDLDAFLR